MVLPAPFGPTRAAVTPSPTRKLTSSSSIRPSGRTWLTCATSTCPQELTPGRWPQAAVPTKPLIRRPAGWLKLIIGGGGEGSRPRPLVLLPLPRDIPVTGDQLSAAPAWLRGLGVDVSSHVAPASG